MKHMKHRRLSKRARKRLVATLFDAFMKITGVAMFFIGLGGLAEIPTDPKMIVRALGLFIGGVCMIAWNSYLLETGERGQKDDRGKRR